MKRKKIFWILTLCLGGFFIFPPIGRAQETWQVETELFQDAKTHVQIAVQSEESVTSWEFLDPKVDIQSVQITNALGEAIEYTINRSDSKITILFPEQTQFTLNYIFNSAVKDLTLYDEWALELLAEPLDRDFRIKKATMRFPGESQKVKPYVFVTPPANVMPEIIAAEQNTSSTFEIQSITVPAGQRVTFVSQLPIGMVSLEKDGFFIQYGYLFIGVIMFSPVALFFVLLFRWLYVGRDQKGEREIYTKISPFLIGLMKDEFIGHQDIAGEIMELAIQNVITIQKKRGTWELRLHKTSSELSPSQALLLQHLFLEGDVIKLNQPVGLARFVRHAYAVATREGLFSVNPHKVRQFYVVFGIILLLVGYLGMLFVVGYPIFFLGIILFIFSILMPQKTTQGLAVKEFAKCERARVLNANAWKDIPLAIVFGLDDELVDKLMGKAPVSIKGIGKKDDLIDLLEQLHLFCARGIHIA